MAVSAAGSVMGAASVAAAAVCVEAAPAQSSRFSRCFRGPKAGSGEGMNDGQFNPFLLPPVLHNTRGEVRKAGFELEYSGVTIADSARLIRDVFGGTHVAESTFEHRVEDTRFGDFKIEIDTKFLKDKQYEAPLRAL